MSNEVMNQHIEFGSPLGDSEGIIEVAEWAGEMLKTARKLIEYARPPQYSALQTDWLSARNDWMQGKP